MALRVLFCAALLARISGVPMLEKPLHKATPTTSESLLAPQRLRGRVLMSTTVATPDCSAIRLTPYLAELRLFYEYSVEFKAGKSVRLFDLERAIANMVAIHLNTCDGFGRPVYKVKTDARHRFSDTVCMPEFNMSNGCIMVNGKTVIFLDDDSSLVRSKAFEAISVGLSDPHLLDGYTDSVVRTAYLATGKALLVEAGQGSDESGDDNPPISPFTATIAAAAASVSFVIASVFCYGFLRKDGRQHSEPSVRHKGHSRKRSSHTIITDCMGGRTKRHFVRLEDLSASPASFVTTTITPMTGGFDYQYPEAEEYSLEEPYAPSITWSVSDITSDSASLRSGLSRTPSMLERIEEELEEESNEENDGDCNSFDYRECQFPCRNRRVHLTVEEFDCKSQRRLEMLDVSGLDECFTIKSSQNSTNNKNAVCKHKLEDVDDGVEAVEEDDSSLQNHGNSSWCLPNETEDVSAEMSQSDFSDSSLLVLADISENDDQSPKTLYQDKVDHDVDGDKTLAYSSTSAKECPQNKDLDDITTNNTTYKKILDDMDTYPQNNLDLGNAEGDETPFECHNHFNDPRTTSITIDALVSTLESEECKDAPCSSGEGMAEEPVSNIDDSIEEWVSELLDEQHTGEEQG